MERNSQPNEIKLPDGEELHRGRTPEIEQAYYRGRDAGRKFERDKWERLNEEVCKWRTYWKKRALVAEGQLRGSGGTADAAVLEAADESHSGSSPDSRTTCDNDAENCSYSRTDCAADGSFNCQTHVSEDDRPSYTFTKKCGYLVGTGCYNNFTYTVRAGDPHPTQCNAHDVTPDDSSQGSGWGSRPGGKDSDLSADTGPNHSCGYPLNCCPPVQAQPQDEPTTATVSKFLMDYADGWASEKVCDDLAAKLVARFALKQAFDALQRLPNNSWLITDEMVERFCNEFPWPMGETPNKDFVRAGLEAAING